MYWDLGLKFRRDWADNIEAKMSKPFKQKFVCFVLKTNKQKLVNDDGIVILEIIAKKSVIMLCVFGDLWGFLWTDTQRVYFFFSFLVQGCWFLPLGSAISKFCSA